MVLILLLPPMSGQPGHGVFQQSLSSAFSIPRGPRDGVPAHIEVLMGLHGPHVGQVMDVCMWVWKVCAADGWRGPGGAGWDGESDFHMNLAQASGPYWGHKWRHWGGSTKASWHSEQGTLVAFMDLNISPLLKGNIKMSVLQHVKILPKWSQKYSVLWTTVQDVRQF